MREMASRTQTPLWVLVLLASVPLAGCLATSPGPAAVTVPRPRVGDTYVYEGPRGARLEVHVAGVVERVDGRMDRRQVVELSWSIRPPGDTYTYERAAYVDRSTGRLVQQLARCIPYEYYKSGDAPRACWDERALVVLAGAAGLPGGFGAGPLWNATIRPGEVPLNLEAQGATRLDGPVYRAQANASRPGCLDIAAPAGTIQRIRPLPTTVAEGPFTVCPGSALPAAFSTHLGTRYRLTHSSAGTQTVTTGPGGPSADGDPPVAMESWSEPFLVDRTDGDPFDFSFQEAHAWAMDNHDRYREVMEGDPGGRVIYDWAMPGGQSRTALTSINTSKRAVAAISPSGEGIEIELEKTDREPEYFEGDSISVDEESPISREVPDPARLPKEMADAESVADLGMRIVGKGLDGIGVKQVYHLRYPPIPPIGGPGPARNDGYTVHLWLEEDPPYPATSAGMSLTAPYGFNVDGPTGAVEWISLNRSRLPIVHHVEAD